ncbi:MAG TPA: right-handed parallel beta-helix repeat-containing protein [Oligoflexia bacterium]|nr:right-handed parallel beta-helix repeat-containing protein [Oligoflexia bacterium]
MISAVFWGNVLQHYWIKLSLILTVISFQACTLENQSIHALNQTHLNDFGPGPTLPQGQELFPINNLNDSCVCDYTIDPQIQFMDAQTINPGSTVCFDAQVADVRQPMTFEHLNGTQHHPIIVKNCNGSVKFLSTGSQAAIKVISGSYFRLTGIQSTGSLGIVLDAPSSPHALAIGKAHHYELDNIHIQSSSFAGIMAKVDPSSQDCRINDRRYDSYVMDTVYVHDNLVENVAGEGFYFGNSFFTGVSDQYCARNSACDLSRCEGIQYPHLVKNIHIFNNHIENTGWDGIQVGSAVDNCSISHNTINNWSTQNRSSQNHAIQVGDGSSCTVENNLLDGGGIGIHLAGIGDSLLKNNTIQNFNEYGIIVNPRPAPLDSDLNGSFYKGGFSIIDNTLVSNINTGPAIRDVNIPSNPVPTDENLIENNTITSLGSVFQLNARYNWQEINNHTF